MHPTQETQFRLRDTDRLKVKGWKKVFHANGNQKQTNKPRWSDNPYFRQNRLQNKEYYKRQRRTLHSDQGINLRRQYNNCVYLCTQHSIHKADTNRNKRGNL